MAEKKCLVCDGSTGNTKYNWCPSCFRKLRSAGTIAECEDCGEWYYSVGSCRCEIMFIQCPDCGRWHDEDDSCICKVQTGEKKESGGYKKRKWLSEAEIAFKKKLEQAIDLKKYEINCQAPLRQLVEKEKSWQYANELHRYIDFCIVLKATAEPVLCIEYDDSSHERDERKERDEKVDGIMKAAGIKLIHILRDDNLSVDYLKGRLSDYL
jgi:hypothetical protein